MKHFKIFLSAIFVFFLVGISTLFIVSKYVYNRSITATWAAFYVMVTDRDAMFESEEVCKQVMAEKEITNLEKITVPEMKISAKDCEIDSMQYIEFGHEKLTDTLIMYFPGGAFVNQPTQEHFDFIEKLHIKTGLPITMCVYPKATNYTCDESYAKAKMLYGSYLSSGNIKHIYFMGDSSGGNFALSLAMQLSEDEVLQPEKLVLLSPWVDLSMENEEMENYTEADVMLGIPGLKYIGQIWAGERNVKDPIVSPLYGSFLHLGEITILVGTREIFYPDIMLLCDRLKTDKADFKLIVKEGMNHVYPLFPITEAQEALQLIVEAIS
ncbi:MAG: alpha/beta hydrolase fold domain-containing protein [Acutalibacteraceae bacterium]